MQGAGFQCEVTAANAGGSSTMISDFRETTPGMPGSGVDNPEYPGVTVETVGGDPVAASIQGGEVFEVCNANPPSNDVCKAGVKGPSLGQFNMPRGIAVDNSPAGEGAVYIGDDFDYRVQKFSADGTPLFEIGRKVNKTTGGGVCGATSGDVCGAGLKTDTYTAGGFGGWPLGKVGGGGDDLSFRELGNTVSVSAGTGELYVTDPNQLSLSNSAGFRPRVQRFDSNGNFLGQVIPSKGQITQPRPIAVGVDTAGTAYVSTTTEDASVNVFEVPEFTPEGTQQELATRHIIHQSNNPVQVAVDPNDDDKIWITDRNQFFLSANANDEICGEPGPSRRAILAYDAAGHRLECDEPTGLGTLTRVSGLAISPSGMAYAAMHTEDSVKVFDLPDVQAPTVSNQSVSTITTETARVHAQVNPGFEPTGYRVEYGLQDCSSGPCDSVEGSENAYGVDDVGVTVQLVDLTPGTRYHYRVVVENPLGSEAGPDKTFVSFPLVDLVNDSCPNALVRKQTGTAGALDCRAYELASADFTGGYDVISGLSPGETPFAGRPDATDKVLYAVRDGGIPGTGSPTNRGPDPIRRHSRRGWMEHEIRGNPRRQRLFDRTVLVHPCRCQCGTRCIRLLRPRNMLAVFRGRVVGHSTSPGQRRAGAGHARLDSSACGRTGRSGRQAPLRRRFASRLRVGCAVRAPGE